MVKMSRVFKITSFVYLTLVCSVIISGGHIDHGIQTHLCFEKCSASGCEATTKSDCTEESILEHVFENGKLTSGQLFLPHIDIVQFPIDTDVILTASFAPLRNAFLIPTKPLFGTASQTRAPPYHRTTI